MQGQGMKKICREAGLPPVNKTLNAAVLLRRSFYILALGLIGQAMGYVGSKTHSYQGKAYFYIIEIIICSRILNLFVEKSEGERIFFLVNFFTYTSSNFLKIFFFYLIIPVTR